ncbi:hypothetical protein ACFRFH_12080 [Leifsonia sp. NPDC056824]|uniref:terminase small subunit n=1 Tax=Leifsonia sp. NPDC056824 TaxID=3345953 RepID=UPI0036C10A1E
MDIVEATETALAAATHLTPMDDGAVESLRALARKIQAWDVIVAFALEDAAEKGGRPAVPQHDNVSLSAYSSLSEQLGLTPMGRKKLELREAKQGGKLNAVRSVAEQRQKSTARRTRSAPRV